MNTFNILAVFGAKFSKTLILLGKVTLYSIHYIILILLNTYKIHYIEIQNEYIKYSKRQGHL